MNEIQKQWDFSFISGRLKGYAEKAIEEGDAVKLLGYMDNTKCLEFVFRNSFLLELRGMYERALVYALSATRTNNALYPPSLLEILLENCDIETLRAAGDPLPAGNTFTIYRGVSGERHYRHVRGLSWTASLNTACWFALRYVEHGLKDPAVYKANIRAGDVYCYTSDRDEQEFICRPKYCKKLNLSIEKMRELNKER